MAEIEQAVFTSARTSRAAGYHLAGRSQGVAEVDARELAVWGPSHDSLLELGPDAASVNFHPLPSGAYCISRTVSAGFEYSGRGGHRVYTQSLVVPPDALRRFANNAFAVVRAALAGGMFQVFDPVPEQLPTLTLVGGAAPVDQNLLARLAVQFGPDRIAGLVQAAMTGECLAVAGGDWTADLIAGLVNCLPPHARIEVPFATGLKYSSRRPFRVLGLSGDPAEHRWIAQHARVTVLDLTATHEPPAPPLDGWARFVGRMLATRRTSLLATELSKRRFEFTAGDLHALGLQLLEEIDASELRGEASEPVEPVGFPPEGGESQSQPCPAGAGVQRAHSAHRQFAKSAASASEVTPSDAPSSVLEADSPEVLERLERLDDLVYEAMSGTSAAMESLRAYWPEVAAELGEELLAESREQYLRYAMSIWEGCVDSQGVRNPNRAVLALDVLCLLFND
ncbi:MAG: hypothetical protein RBS80_22160 [Thermoguttaceae bacterium]|jgi:hypothetical protein|nr:hypothetical protein [Thermoguttaceae bacterium]